MVNINSFPSLLRSCARHSARALVAAIISLLVFCVLLGLSEFVLSAASATSVAGFARKHLIPILLTAPTAALITWLATKGARSHRMLGQVANERLDALDAEKLRSAELAAAAQSKSEFLSMMSHELRSPVQVIVASADVLGFHIPADERDQAVQRIRRSSAVLSARLRELLTLTRGEANKLEILPESFEVRTLVEGLAGAAGADAAGKGLDLLTDLPNEPIFAMADASRISQILSNLISNAVKYTQRGRVAIELEPVTPDSDKLVFHVTDTGPGIAPWQLEMAFQPFERVGVIGVPEESAGVGLMIVRTLVRLLGGVINVDSDVGKGTRVTVCLPAVIEDPDARHGERGTGDAILIVGADPTSLVALRAMMAGFGRPCETAFSAGAAMNYLASRAYCAVFVDVDVLGQSARRLATETRRMEGPNKSTYFVAMGAPVTGDEAVVWRFDCFLRKPIESPSLEGVLSRFSPASRR